MNKRRRRLALSIDTLAAGGDGVGRDEEGRVTFVPRAAPGEKVLVELLEEKKQFARGKVVEILAPSSERVEPKCELFAKNQCGGCQWQHVSVSAQRAAKETNVDSALRKSIARGMERAPAQAPCQPYGWRRRARLSFWAGGGTRVLGFFPPKSKTITDIPVCVQLEPALQKSLETLRKILLPALRQRGEVELLLAEDGQCHVAIHGTVTPKGLQMLAAAEGIAGVVNGKNILAQASVLLEGEVRASAAQFAQASRAGNLALCQTVQTALGPLTDKSVLELYAGGGNFTRNLTEAQRVVAVEITPIEAPPAGVDWRVGDVAETVAALAKAGEQFDILLLDPPRTGAREVLPAAAQLAPKTIVYVSCDVATLARDAEILHELGYRAQSAHPIDIMPQTSHVEVVMVFLRQSAN